MRKFLKFTHKWLSIPTGIIITVVCLTGALLVFQDEILEMVHPTHYFIKDSNKEPIPLGELIPMVNRQLDSNSVANVTIYAESDRTYRMGLKEGFRETAFVNQYTGEVTGFYKFRESGFYPIMCIHRWLMDDTRTWGKYAVGISTLVFIIILITGVIIWVPRKFKKAHFKVSLKNGRRRLFYDLHNVLGIYACILLLVMSLSGLMWSFEWYRNGIFSIFGAEVAQTQGHGGGNRQGGGRTEGQEKPEMNILQWQNILNNLKEQNEGYEYIRVQDGSASVHLKSAALSRNSDNYTFDKRSGEIVDVKLFRDQEKTSKVWAWMYSLHVGNYWGLLSKILTFIVALIGASLPITGYYLFFVRKRRRT